VTCGVMSGIFVGDSIWLRALAGFTGAVIALVLVLFITYVVYLWITPVRQRNEARREIEKLDKQISDLRGKESDVKTGQFKEPNGKIMPENIASKSDSLRSGMGIIDGLIGAHAHTCSKCGRGFRVTAFDRLATCPKCGNVDNV